LAITPFGLLTFAFPLAKIYLALAGTADVASAVSPELVNHRVRRRKVAAVPAEASLDSGP
jgi:hypothetical protein